MTSSSSNATTAPLWSDSGDLHRGTYRVFCLMAAVLTPAFGVVYQFTDPDGIDPMWGRFTLSVALLLLLSLSYMVRWVERNFVQLVQGSFYILMVYVIGVTWLNEFTPNYALAMLFTFTAMGVVFSLGLQKKTAPLVRYLVFTIAFVGVATLVSAPSQVSLWVVWGCAAATGAIIYLAAAAKMKAEALFSASEHRFHTLMDAANDAILIADPVSNLLVHANQKALELTNLPKGDVSHTRLFDLFPPASRDRSVELLEGHLATRQPIPEDLFVTDGDGGAVAVDVSASLIDVDGHQYIQGIFRDATDRHRYEAQLIEAKEHAEELLQLKSSLLNNMSHELRTPLTAVLGFAEVLAENVDETQREHAEYVLRGAERLYDTVNSVLGLAQLEAGDAKIELRPVDLAVHLRESLELLQPLADEKGLPLRLTVRTARVHALTDTMCLDRIITNLVGNAIKFTDEGEVEVELSAREDRVLIRVRDTGIGIDEAFLPRLFDEFQQESRGLARTYEGNGLGLTITQRLVELIEGSVTVESEKGVGSTFTVALPRVVTVDEAGESAGDGEAAYGHGVPVAQGPAGALPGTNQILVVEDNAVTRELIVKRLGTICQLALAEGPQRAIEIAQHHRFDALLLDINLTSSMDGVDLLRELRKMPAHAQTPAVAMTAYAMPGDRERFLSAGFDHYLSKPFTSQEFLAVINDLLRESPPAGGPSGTPIPTLYHV